MISSTKMSKTTINPRFGAYLMGAHLRCAVSLPTSSFKNNTLYLILAHQNLPRIPRIEWKIVLHHCSVFNIACSQQQKDNPFLFLFVALSVNAQGECLTLHPQSIAQLQPWNERAPWVISSSLQEMLVDLGYV